MIYDLTYINAIKLMLFSYSLEGAARIWYENGPPNSILTWVDLVNKFVNQFFPPSKTTHLKNEISRFTQRFKETFGEAWDRFKEMLRACPHHGFSELTQIDRFYNGLTEQDQDSLNATSGGNLLNKTAREALKIIENKSKVRYSRSKLNVSRVNTSSRDDVIKTDDRIDKLVDQILNLVEIVNKQVIAPAKAVEKTCVTCGGDHAYYDCISTDSNQPSVCAATSSYNQVSSPNRASHQIPPPGFAPIQNNPNRFHQNQGQRNYFNQANNFNQRNNFNKGNNFQSRRSNRRRVPNIVELEIRTIEEIVLMADDTMEELLQAPTEGYGESIIILEILAENFEIKTNLLQACPHHGFSELTQIDTFYNGLTEQDQDSLNVAAGGNLLNKTTREALKIIENKLKVRYSRSKSNVSRVNTNSRDSVSKTDDRIDKLADQISNLVEIVNKQVITPSSAKAVEKTCVTYGGAHAYYDCIATDSNQLVFVRQLVLTIRVFKTNHFQYQNNQIQQGVPNEFSSYMKSNEIMIKSMQNHINVLRGDFNKQEENLKRNLNNDMRSILGGFFQNQPLTSGTLPSNIVPNPKGEMKVVTTCSGLAYEGPKYRSSPTSVVPISIPKPDVSRTQPKPTIPYPSRLNDQKLREKATNQMEKFFQIFHDLHFDISFADALLLMPKFSSTIKSLLANKDKLFELAKVPLNENCSAMLLKNLPEKLGVPGKFLITCDFPGMEVCRALADLGARINLMPLSIWKKLSLSELTPTRMTLELADRSITRPKGVAEDVFVKVGNFHFLTNFVVVDFEADPRVPLILGRSFLRIGRALIDVYGKEITLRYNPKSSNPTLVSDPSISKSDFSKELIVKSSSPTLTPFRESDFFLEEIEDFLNDDLIPTGIENSMYDPEGDILFLEKLLNEDPFQLPLMDLKLAEETKAKSFVEKPPELELKELPSHLEYAFLEESNKLPVIIAKDLKDVEKEALIKILKSHTRAIS
uniref:Reverse transcriptase domain-containing protein n=1 Tax=Tanacetum cinerariifolium TaxID=118510 RepID=A0A699I2J0_TANCI|nr:reverse transcriptase domain-containing protein [Tanacetum cinerariifolium]